MFPSLATQDSTLFQQQILRLGSKKMFLNQVKNISASRTQMLLPEHVSQFSHGGNNFTSLATESSKTFIVLPASLATQETLRETNVSVTIMFPSLDAKATRHFLCFPLV